jgi:hypothetical protein
MVTVYEALRAVLAGDRAKLTDEAWVKAAVAAVDAWEGRNAPVETTPAAGGGEGP